MGCPFHEYAFPAAFGTTFVLGFILLRLVGKNRLKCGDYIFGAYNLMCFVAHSALDTYFLYTPRLLKKQPNEVDPNPDDHLGCFKAMVTKMWREYGDADTRVYQDDFQPHLLTMTMTCGVAVSSLCLLAFLGHLFGGRWAHGMQIAAGMLQFAMIFSFTFPEYLVNFKNVKDKNMFLGANVPFMVIPLLAVASGLCRLCCPGGVCPFSPCGTTSAPSHADKKKKQ